VGPRGSHPETDDRTALAISGPWLVGLEAAVPRRTTTRRLAGNNAEWTRDLGKKAPPYLKRRSQSSIEGLSADESAGTIAFCRSGDPATGEFGDAKLIRKFGDVPDDLSAL
jgi:hypothetical protein